MIKNEREIEELHDKYWMKTFHGLSTDETIRYRDIGRQSSCSGFIAGFKKCEEIFLESASDEFDEWAKNEGEKLRISESKKYIYPWCEMAAYQFRPNNWVRLKIGYQAAKLSSLKEIEYLKTKLAQVEARNKEYEEIIQSFSREFGNDDFDSMDIAEHHLMLFRNALNSGKGE